MPSTSSLPEPFMRANHPNPAPRCQTVRASNGRQCVWNKEMCDINEGHHDGIQSFSDAGTEPKDSLPRGGAEGVHVHEWGDWECIGLDRAEVWIRRCLCGASQSRSEKPQEPVCTHCQGPHALEDCKGLEEPEECASCGGEHPSGDCVLCACGHDRSLHKAGLKPPFNGCDWCSKEECGGYRTEEDAERCCSCGSADVVYRNYREQDFCEHCSNCTCGHVPCVYTPPADIPRRPPYAVAYAVEGGAQYEVAVSGDATVVAEDGALHILHPKTPVLAIVRVQPMNMEESDG